MVPLQAVLAIRTSCFNQPSSFPNPAYDTSNCMFLVPKSYHETASMVVSMMHFCCCWCCVENVWLQSRYIHRGYIHTSYTYNNLHSRGTAALVILFFPTFFASVSIIYIWSSHMVIIITSLAHHPKELAPAHQIIKKRSSQVHKKSASPKHKATSYLFAFVFVYSIPYTLQYHINIPT